MERRSIAERFALPGLLLLALIIRLAMVFVLRGNPYTFDSQVYLAMANAISEERPAASFPNGYPVLIALLKAALPDHLLTNALLILNALAGTATVGLAYLIARWLTSLRIALIVGAVLALYPHQVHYTRLVMTETLCAFLVTLGAFLLLYPTYGMKKGDRDTKDGEDTAMGLFFVAGTALHYASVVRPSVNLVFPIALVAGLLLKQPKKLLALFAAGFALSFAIFFGLDRLGITQAPAATANNMLISINTDSRFVEFREFSKEEQEKAASTYLNFVVTKPGQFIMQRAIALWELWGFWSLPGNKPENATPMVRFVVFIRFFLLVAGTYAFWRHRKQFFAWVLFAPVIGITLLHTASFANHRFVVPAEPLLFVLAALGVQEILSRRSGKAVSERDSHS